MIDDKFPETAYGILPTEDDILYYINSNRLRYPVESYKNFGVFGYTRNDGPVKEFDNIEDLITRLSELSLTHNIMRIEYNGTWGWGNGVVSISVVRSTNGRTNIGWRVIDALARKFSTELVARDEDASKLG